MKTAITRRRALVSTAAIVGGGATMAIAASGNARATVSTNDLQIPDATHEGEDTSVADVRLNVQGSYQFSTNEATGYKITLAVASAPDLEDYQTIDSVEDIALAASTGGQYELGGSLLAHSNLDANGFSVDPGNSMTKDIAVRVVLEVLNGDKVITNAVANTTATVEVTSTEVAVSSEIGGSGSVTVEV